MKWDGAQKQAVHHKVFKGINHVDMLRRGLELFPMIIIATYRSVWIYFTDV